MQNLVMQECSPTSSNAYQGLENNNNNNNNNSVNSLLFHQFQIPNALPQVHKLFHFNIFNLIDFNFAWSSILIYLIN